MMNWHVDFLHLSFSSCQVSTCKYDIGVFRPVMFGNVDWEILNWISDRFDFPWCITVCFVRCSGLISLHLWMALTLWPHALSFSRSASASFSFSPCARMPHFAQTPARQRNAALALASTNRRTGAAPAGVYHGPVCLYVCALRCMNLSLCMNMSASKSPSLCFLYSVKTAHTVSQSASTTHSCHVMSVLSINPSVLLNSS